MPPPAVVLGLGVNGLGVVRGLGSHGVPVIGVYQRAEEAGRLSRYCRAVRVMPIERDRGEFLRTLVRLGSRQDRPVLFPTNDEYLQVISDCREELAPLFRFSLPDAKTLEMVVTKHGIQTLAERHGMPIPVTRYPQTDVDVAALGRDMRFPCLVKPIDTFTIRFPQGAKNAVVSSPDELEGFYRRHPSLLGRTIVQQIIRGGDGAIFVCAAYLNAQSEALVVYTGRKIRQYPPDYGITSVGESVYLPELERLTVEFLRAVGYRGLIGAEYVQDRATGAMYLLELNARSSYYNRLPTDCGINLAYTAYRDLIGDRVTDRPRQRDGVRWLDVLHDLGSFYATRRHRRMTWREWLASVLPARSFAYFDARDLKPFVYSVGQTLSVLGHKAAADIRSRGRSRARSG